MSHNDATSFKSSAASTGAAAATPVRRQERDDESRKARAAEYRSAMQYCINNDLI